jgi:hypothetical protein
MSAFSTSKELRTIFGGFIESVAKNELKGFSGSGFVLAYNVTEPDGRFVLDSRPPLAPGRGFDVYIDDPNAPPASADVFLSADTLDRMYSGELNVMNAAAEKLIRTKGDRLAVVRLLPAMFRLVPQYKAFRERLHAVSQLR